MGHGHGNDAPATKLPASMRRALALALAPFLLATVVGLVVLWPDGAKGRGFEAAADLYDATVRDVAPGRCEGGGRCVDVEVELTSGPDRGTQVQLGDLSLAAGAPQLERGDKVVVGRDVSIDEGASTYYFNDFQRGQSLLLLGALFAVMVVGVARWRGVAAIAGLAVTWLVLVEFVLPAVLAGTSPVAVSLVGGAAILVVVLYLAHGFNGRTTVALLGTLVSLGLTAGLAAMFVGASHVSGSSEEAIYVQTLNARVSLTGLLLAGIVIGCLGVLNDVTVTQASAIWEIHHANPSRGIRPLWQAGMRVGRDHIASVVDTLVLAYAGASLPLLLLFSLSSQGVGAIVTSDIVAEEIVRGLVGSIGLVASVPITTALAALVVTRAET